MRQSATKRKKYDYPDETNGARWAARNRKKASDLNPEQEAECFRDAMAQIYGGQSKKTVRAGH